MWPSKCFTRIISTVNVVGREQKSYKILTMGNICNTGQNDPNKVNLGG
jgi:hypothetical protein